MKIRMCSPVFVMLLFAFNTYGQITIFCEYQTRETIFPLSINASDIKCDEAGNKGIDLKVAPDLLPFVTGLETYWEITQIDPPSAIVEIPGFGTAYEGMRIYLTKSDADIYLEIIELESISIEMVVEGVAYILFEPHPCALESNLSKTACGLKMEINSEENACEVQMPHDNPFGMETDELTVEQFDIFPNPVNNELIIRGFSKEVYTQISLFDLNGNLIYSSSINSEFLEIDVSDFSTGIYFAELSNSSGAQLKSTFNKH